MDTDLSRPGFRGRRLKRLAVPAVLLAAVLLTSVPTDAWQQALKPHPFSFPADHGSHPEYQTEWWYLTGHLTSAAGHRFGYQFTIFRQGINEAVAIRSDNPWQVRDLYVLHCALSDIDQKKFYQHQDISRAGPGLAGAAVGRLETWLKGNRLVYDAGSGQLLLSVVSPDFQLELSLEPPYEPVLNGDHGLSAKGGAPGQASQYYSWPQLSGKGRLILARESPEESQEVTAACWLDREFATNQLSPNQAGWDWFALNFSDGQALMLYRMRLKDGGQDAASSGTWIFADGRGRHLSQDDFRLTPKRTWRSPGSGAEYPLVWEVEIFRPRALKFTVRALLDRQEMQTGDTTLANYWEGAVEVIAEQPPALGYGYLEMTGYDRDLSALKQEDLKRQEK